MRSLNDSVWQLRAVSAGTCAKLKNPARPAASGVCPLSASWSIAQQSWA